MRVATVWSILAGAALLMTGCGGEDDVAKADELRSGAPRVGADAGAAQSASAALEAFASDLYSIQARNEGNLVLSPYSIAVALAMARAGAAGETAVQMDSVLHAKLAGDLDGGFNAIEQSLTQVPGEYNQGDQTVELDLGTANRLWGQRGFEFETAYLDRLASYYGAGMMLVDYVEERDAARDAINSWVAAQTNERIPELIPEGLLSELTRLVLTNAIYLKAPWLYPFEPASTEAAPFRRLDGTEVSAEMMTVSARVRYAMGTGYEAVELPYVGGRLSMVVVVPGEGEFTDFESRLDGALLREVVEGLRDAQVDLRLPRFEFRSQALLKTTLSELGMPIAFTEAADFSAMSPAGDDLAIQEVVHEAFIAVDEHGTEAAAATAVNVGIVSAPELNVELTVDRPFVFLIRDAETGAVLFLGRVVDPQS